MSDNLTCVANWYEDVNDIPTGMTGGHLVNTCVSSWYENFGMTGYTGATGATGTLYMNCISSYYAY